MGNKTIKQKIKDLNKIKSAVNKEIQKVQKICKHEKTRTFLKPGFFYTDVKMICEICGLEIN